MPTKRLRLSPVAVHRRQGVTSGLRANVMEEETFEEESWRMVEFGCAEVVVRRQGKFSYRKTESRAWKEEYQGRGS